MRLKGSRFASAGRSSTIPFGASSSSKDMLACCRPRRCGHARRDGGAQGNDPAWAAVAADNVSQQVLDDAISAVKQTKQENAARLRTLATAYAELGKTSEALENLRRAVELRGERIDGADWYVLGRIAERYGLNEVAAGLYRKVPAGHTAASDSVYALAQRRLKKVQK